MEIDDLVGSHGGSQTQSQKASGSISQDQEVAIPSTSDEAKNAQQGPPPHKVRSVASWPLKS